MGIAQESRKETKKKGEKSFYGELESRYVGYEELMRLVLDYARGQRRKKSEEIIDINKDK